MARWSPGQQTINFLLQRGRLEPIDIADVTSAANTALDRASRRLRTATAGFTGGDLEGAFAAAYDAYRMAAESLLIHQGLRATGGEGSHMTVEDAVGAQFAGEIRAFAKPTFERFRRTRHTAQYFDPSAPPIEQDDARWALRISQEAVDGVTELLASSPPGVFSTD